jgi:chromate reductase
MIEVVGISGSLRTASYNTLLLHAAMELAPEGMRITPASIDLPLYNEDLREQGYPAAVSQLRSQLAKAHAVLIVTPEYNYSIPGVLKNAIDWVSRPPDQPFNKKPVAIMGASPGRIGTARAQYHLRQIFVCLDAAVLNKPEVMVGGVAQLFNDNGQLTDTPTREHVTKLLSALAERVQAENR